MIILINQLDFLPDIGLDVISGGIRRSPVEPLLAE